MTRLLLESPDVSATVAFYTALLGWRAEASGEEVVLYDGDDSAVVTVRPTDGTSRWLPQFPVGDLEVAAAVCTSAGVTFARTDQSIRVDDAWGARFCLFLDPALDAAAPRAVGIVDVGVFHAEPALRFYRELLGWESVLLRSGYHLFVAHETPVGGLWSAEGEIGERIWNESPVGWTVYLRVADCDAAVVMAAELGARITVPPYGEAPTGPFAFLVDPCGAEFGVASPPPPDELLSQAVDGARRARRPVS